MVKNFHYITNFAPDRKEAKVSILKPITNGFEGINGADFASELRYLANEGVEVLTIDINSKGGNIQEGFSIFQAIKDFPGKTITRVIGIAASMAGMISQAGDERIILDYALFHTHGPQAPKGKTVEAGLINIMKESLTKILVSKSGISEEKAGELLSGENLFTAAEALQLGFFDHIESSKDYIELTTENSVDDLFEMANEFINTKPNKMDKVVSFLGLENTANEEAVLKSVEELKNSASKVEELTNSLTEKTEKVTELEASLEEANNKVNELKKAAAVSLINNAVKSGKLQKESTEKWLEIATNDLEQAEELLKALGTGAKAQVIENVLEVEGAENNDRKDWDFQKWSEDDPKGLEQMKNENPTKFDELLNAYVEDVEDAE